MKNLLADLGRFLRKKNASAPDLESGEGYVRMAYRVLLRREIDSAGLGMWRERIASCTFRQQDVIDSLLNSEEYVSRFAVDVIAILHRSRQAWIKTLARFDAILDIGGSSMNDPRGALIELGYLHRPKRLDILDLPPDRQYWGKPTYDQSIARGFEWGEVTYFHGSAERIERVSGIQNSTYDCIFLGQAIEHVRPEALPNLLGWMRRHLAPAGRLVLDTPNRLLTKIQCPNSFTDPDHKHEYAPAELQEIIERAGFEVTVRSGLVHLPRQSATGKYDPGEFAGATLRSVDVDACFLFALEAKLR